MITDQKEKEVREAVREMIDKFMKPLDDSEHTEQVCIDEQDMLTIIHDELIRTCDKTYGTCFYDADDPMDHSPIVN